MKADGAAASSAARHVDRGRPARRLGRVEAGAADDDERDLVRRLRVIASIGDVHRSTDRPRRTARARSSAAPPSSRRPCHGERRLAIVESVHRPIAPGGGPAPARRADSPSQPASRPPPAPPASHAVRRTRASARSAISVGPLELRERVGAGVFGEVYRASTRSCSARSRSSCCKTASAIGGSAGRRRCCTKAACSPACATRTSSPSTAPRRTTTASACGWSSSAAARSRSCSSARGRSARAKRR